MYIYFDWKKKKYKKNATKIENKSQYGNANEDWKTVTMRMDVPVLFQSE